ncbi:MAG: RluA family pseudouridine synthase [Paracoccaceae bacterium]
MGSNFQYDPPLGRPVIVHRDGALLVVNKPAGLLSVPGKAEAHRDCLESRVKSAFPDALLVHRLDMDTSGLMLFAMTRAAQRHLGLQFERRHVDKLYQARVWGRVQDSEGVVDLPLATDWPNRPLQKVCFATGRAALTRWRLIARDDETSCLELRPRTGRSHQLRVHMRELGHPILGDRFYSQGAALNASKRLLLHAESLSFFHPEGGRRVTFVASCPF